MGIKNIMLILASASTLIAAPVDVDATTETLTTRSVAPPVPIGINIWGSSHENCEKEPTRSPWTFPALQYNDGNTTTVETSFTSYSLSRPLAENERIEFYTGGINYWTMKHVGNQCEALVGTADWTTQGGKCTQVSPAETGANCIRLIKQY
ncbi:MAG: hypothetical protein Q9165_004651 [Trypethelium subeluteriae]